MGKHHKVQTEWQWSLSSLDSFMVVKSAHGEGGGARPPPFTLSTITSKVVVYALSERACRFRTLFLLYPYMNSSTVLLRRQRSVLSAKLRTEWQEQRCHREKTAISSAAGVGRGVIETTMERRIHRHLIHPNQRPLRPLRPPKLLQTKMAILRPPIVSFEPPRKDASPHAPHTHWLEGPTVAKNTSN
jgi:hypothetical protein